MATDFATRFSSAAPRPADVPPGAAFDAWHVRILSVDEFESLSAKDGQLSEAQLVYLSWLGGLAPTSHNTVPQRFQLCLQASQLVLWLDRKFVLPESDPNGRQALISCGCAAAYVELAARAYGWHALPSLANVPAAATLPNSAQNSRYTELASIALQRGKTDSLDISTLRALTERKSMRVDYDPKVELDDGVISAMKCVLTKFPELRMNLLSDGVTLSMLGKFQEMADTFVYNRASFARELGDWLLPNDDSASVGMRGAEFGLSDDAALHMHRGLRGLETLLPDEVAALAKGSNRAIRSATAVVVLSVEHDTVAARFAAGRAFAELALILHTHGFATAMHAAITEVEAPNMALRGRLRSSWRPTVVFRLGKPARVSDNGRPHSARPPVSQLLIADNPKP